MSDCNYKKIPIGCLAVRKERNIRLQHTRERRDLELTDIRRSKS